MPHAPKHAAHPPSLDWLKEDLLLELISHDLNNLCHGAMSYLDLALDPKSPADVRAKFGAQARALVRRAALFTQSVRTLKELSAADLSGASEPLEDALDDARSKALVRHPGASLQVEKAGDAWSARARGGTWVAQALLQVLDNSVQYSRDGMNGKVHADASRDGQMLRVTLRDEGRGFTAGQEAYALRRFSERDKVSGGGIGLAIVRLVAERAGGAVEAAAAKSPAGVIVTLRLPESR